MISIITAFYQAEDFLDTAIQSVLNQNFKDWELILINDGSKDKSKEIALSYSDSRIQYYEQKNQGVSKARNIGLNNMNGDYFCFFDADDFLPPNSLRSRLSKFSLNPKIQFVDGCVAKMKEDLKTYKASWSPNYNGNPLYDLVSLTGNSFFGPTWMIKRNAGKEYKFETELSHSEDLYFYMQLARAGGDYTFTDETVLHYRDTPNSAMKNLQGLEAGYRYVENQIKNWREVDKDLLKTYKYRYKRAMFLAYLSSLQPIKAIKSIF